MIYKLFIRTNINVYKRVLFRDWKVRSLNYLANIYIHSEDIENVVEIIDAVIGAAYEHISDNYGKNYRISKPEFNASEPVVMDE